MRRAGSFEAPRGFIQFSGSLKPLQNLFIYIINADIIGWACYPPAAR